jgi:hypothetical protein
MLAGLSGVSSAIPAEAQGVPNVGPVIISPELGDWDDYQRPLFRASGFDLAKLHLAPGFATFPDHVEDLIEDGAETIMLKTEDCRTDAHTTYAHLVERGFLDLVQQYPEIQFVIQAGNEPERCPVTMDEYLSGLMDIALNLRPAVDQPNLNGSRDCRWCQ